MYRRDVFGELLEPEISGLELKDMFFLKNKVSLNSNKTKRLRNLRACIVKTPKSSKTIVQNTFKEVQCRTCSLAWHSLYRRCNCVIKVAADECLETSFHHIFFFGGLMTSTKSSEWVFALVLTKGLPAMKHLVKGKHVALLLL